MTQPHKRTKRLKRLEMARCHLNEHAFYELIPLIIRYAKQQFYLYPNLMVTFLIRTEFVSLEGNEFSSLELKIFARQLRESQHVKLETLVLNNCGLNDECLNEASKFVPYVPHLQLQNGDFTISGIKHLVRNFKKAKELTSVTIKKSRNVLTSYNFLA